MARCLVILVLSAVFTNCAVLRGKAFYCRDPDTGKLHAVNTTWAASSFCGNYSCNIRKRNVSSSEPIREFNITGIDIKDHQPNVTEKVTVTVEKKLEPDLLTILHRTVTPQPKYTMDKSISKTINNNQPSDDYFDQKNNKPIKSNCKMGKTVLDGNDRYLTEQEIESIADMLHTVKRSDLDAVVDIYNLAQDIYKELEETTTENMRNEALELTKEEMSNKAFNIFKEIDIHKHRYVKEPSYWYDPLANKEKMDETYDLNLHKTLHVASTIKPQPVQPSIYEGRMQSQKEETPVYYPVTQFQRISSYTHPTYPPYRTTQTIYNKMQSGEHREDVPTKNPNENSKSDSLKLIRPSHYLPYPFANIHPYNLTETRNIYYGHPWMLDYYNKYRYYQPYYRAYIGPFQKAVLINPHLNSEVQDIEQHIADLPVELKKENILNEDLIDTLLKGHITPSWKTNPLPVEVLKDIRADIDTTRLLKAFPLRKKIKLEKVGKFMNMGDVNGLVNNRNKRFSADVDQKENTTEDVTNNGVGEYETYLEKVTCHDQMKLGYFRIGNITEPYPGCCPQLIDTR